MLPKLEGYAAALLGSLEKSVLATVSSEVTSLEQSILSQAALRGVLTDTSISGPARGQILGDLLTSKVSEPVKALSVYAATSVPAQDVPKAFAELSSAARTFVETGSYYHASLGLLEARRRVSGYADFYLNNLDTASFERIEEELFTWARTIEGNLDLRRLLLDRDAVAGARVAITEQLLSGKVHAVTLALANFVVVGGRPRDVVGTLDYLVDYVAKARDWRVARVHTARALDNASRQQLVSSLAMLTGKNVELQVAEDASLLGGVLVEVGDLRLDATTRGRLGALRDVVASGRLYESALHKND
jgi:F-type H+-transporting ATPase subunit delta